MPLSDPAGDTADVLPRRATRRRALLIVNAKARQGGCPPDELAAELPKSSA